jgi:hypothetical protein
MGFFDEYKPFRNYMRRFDLVGSLVDMWCYSTHVMGNRPLPAGYAVGKPFGTTVRSEIWPWDLDILSREIVLNAGTLGDRSLRKWNDFAHAINHIKRLDDGAYRVSGEKADVLFELHRIAHRQFPWQIKIGVGPLMRAFKVFSHDSVERIVIRELGMTMKQFLLLGSAVTGHFQNKWGMSTDQDYAVLGISKEISQAFFDRITCTIDDLRSATAKQQSYGPDWLYAWSPLEATPLVRFDRAHPDRVLCPIPEFLLRRTSVGVFYDLVNAPGFDNPFGDSFQVFVGEVINEVCKPPRFTILAEVPYYVGSNKFHGADWVLSDNTGHFFIEAKTKRLTLNARIRSDNAALERDLTTMAKAIVQHYRNICDAVEGKTRWKPDGNPIYPLVLTLEDWFIFSPRITESLNGHVRRLLAEQNISEKVLTDMPYTIASAHEFELATQVIAQAGIRPVMSKKTAIEQWNWSLLRFLNDNFKAEMKLVKRGLFADDFMKLLPDPPNPVVTARREPAGD